MSSTSSICKNAESLDHQLIGKVTIILKSWQTAIPCVRDRKRSRLEPGWKTYGNTRRRRRAIPRPKIPLPPPERLSATEDPISCPMRRRQNAPLHTVRTPEWVSVEHADGGRLYVPTFAGFPTFCPMTFHLLASYSLIAANNAALCSHSSASLVPGRTQRRGQTSSSAKSA